MHKPDPEACLFSAEHARIKHRRKRFGRPADGPRLALALSGGGIRSATFALGVMQALAETRPDGQPASSTQATTLQDERSWLSHFDYLSTVSGGGYLGAFFGSLFVPGRFRAGSTPEEAAQQAFEVMRIDPPPRFSPGRRTRSTLHNQAAPAGRPMPLAWLRENGRYLLPTGAGDSFYALALFVRNLLSVHFVLGMLAVLLLTLLALAGHALGSRLGLPWGYAPLYAIAGSATAADTGLALLWSPLWYALPLLLLVWSLPAGVAYWFSYRLQERRETHLPYTLLSGLLLLAFTALTLLAEYRNLWSAADSPWRVLRHLAWALVWLGVAARLQAAWYRHRATRAAALKTAGATDGLGGEYRVQATRGVAASLLALLAVAAFALIESLGMMLYSYLQSEGSSGPLTISSLLSLLGTLLAAVRYLARFFDEKTASGWLSRVPLDLLSGVAAMLLGLLVLTLWACLVQWVSWGGHPPVWPADQPAQPQLRLAALLALSVLLSVVAGSIPGFIRRSSLQQFYAARLGRAYLGASNGQRFSSTEYRNYSSAEPMPGDDITLPDYFRDSLAPLHLINCTLNQTLGPGEQLVQRDRKGKPVCLSAYEDGSPCWQVDGKAARLHQPRSGEARLSYWMATSGAAFSTGLGRTTTLGLSLLCGMANIWLGGWQMLRTASMNRQSLFDTGLWRHFANQTLLLREWSARFHGLHSRWQYLSDGGHFENMGIYELLRPGRRSGLILACDCGADPDYHFEDLANLIRLARVDLQLEIEVDTQLMAQQQLAHVFATPEALHQAALQRKTDSAPADDGRCAVLLNVYRAGQIRPAEPECRIVLIKPRTLAGMPVDLMHYTSLNPAFPQQTTIDQSFDDQQWESYRKLGRLEGERVLAALANSALLDPWNAPAATAPGHKPYPRRR